MNDNKGKQTLMLVQAVLGMLDDIEFTETEQLSFVTTLLYAIAKRFDINPVVTSIHLTSAMMDIVEQAEQEEGEANE